MTYHNTFMGESSPDDKGIPYFTSGYLIIPPIISSIATAFVIIVALSFKLHKSPVGIMILGINLSDFIYALIKSTGAFLPVNSDDSCKILVFLGNISFRASLLWGVFFGHAFFMTIRNKGTHILQGLVKWYVILSVSIPFVLSLINWFAAYVTYDKESASCVTRPEHPLNYGLLKVGPVFLGFILSLYWYIQGARHITMPMIQKNVRELLILLMFPMIVLVCWLPTNTVQMIQHVEGFARSEQASFGKFLQAFAYLHGFFDALVYGRSVNMIAMLYEKCKTGNSVDNQQSIVGLEQVSQVASQETTLAKGNIYFTAEEDLEGTITVSLLSASERSPRETVNN